MPRLGTRSRTRLDSCHEDLQDVCNEAIKDVDFSVIWGYRDMEAQQKAYRDGHSSAPWPTSKHNASPSNAVDIVPYPGGYNASPAKFYELASYIFAAAIRLDVHLRWGGHWKNFTGKGDLDRDWAHFELLE